MGQQVNVWPKRHWKCSTYEWNLTHISQRCKICGFFFTRNQTRANTGNIHKMCALYILLPNLWPGWRFSQTKSQTSQLAPVDGKGFFPGWRLQSTAYKTEFNVGHPGCYGPRWRTLRIWDGYLIALHFIVCCLMFVFSSISRRFLIENDVFWFVVSKPPMIGGGGHDLGSWIWTDRFFTHRFCLILSSLWKKIYNMTIQYSISCNAKYMIQYYN